jgi:CheY-like chemotaxis protein/HD-like signal output (HDOD) protein
MANILLLDSNETARKAMQGILARGGHHFATVATGPEAWVFINSHAGVDLVFVELVLQEGSGLPFIERIKRDCLLKLLPVVVYTGHTNRDAVKRGLELRVQNFLIKPYHEDDIFAEIAKATSNPWRNRHFEERKSFCKMMGYEPDVLQLHLENLHSVLELARNSLLKHAEHKTVRAASEELAVLSNQAEAAGAWGVVDCLKNLNDNAKSGNWTEFVPGLETLEFASRLIFQHLNPTLVPMGFLSEHEQLKEIETHDHAVWFNAPLENRCPVANWPQLQRELDELSGCPIIESVAALFQMAANGHPSCLNPLMDLVDKDPGLAGQMLIAANSLRQTVGNDLAAIEDPRLAMALLGEVRLASQARGLVTTPDRFMAMPPTCNWQQFLIFQIGTARTAMYACNLLDFKDLAALAYTAGLLHDLGKLLLMRLHPIGLRAIFEYARKNRLPLLEAEQLFLGCSTYQMAAYFAEKQGLPLCFSHVMRWLGAPLEATENKELVAVVALARNLCRHNGVGFSGDQPINEALPLEETEEWGVLRQSVFPSFNLRNFELQMHTECRELKLELQRRLSNSALA